MASSKLEYCDLERVKEIRLEIAQIKKDSAGNNFRFFSRGGNQVKDNSRTEELERQLAEELAKPRLPENPKSKNSTYGLDGDNHGSYVDAAVGVDIKFFVG